MVVVNVGELVPAGKPLTVHAYTGVAPPLVGVAVKVTLCPWQIAPAGFAATVTDGATTGLTVITIAVEVAEAGCAQPLLDVITTVTWSPLAKALFE